MNTARLVDGTVEVQLRPARPAASDAIFLQELDLGFPAPREVKQDAPDVDGTLDYTSLHGSRVVNAKLYVRGNAALPRGVLIDRLRAMSAPGRRPYLYVQRDDWDGERRTQLRAGQFSCVHTAKSAAYDEISMSWQAPSGIFEAATYTEATIYPPTEGSGGLALTPAAAGAAAGTGLAGLIGQHLDAADYGDAAADPALGLAGLAIPPGTGTNRAVITNAGTSPIAPVLYAYGRCTDPIIANLTTGRQFAMSMTVPAGHFLLIDAAKRSVLLDGDPSLPYDTRINWTGGSWPLLAPGDNELEFDTFNITSSCYLNVQFYPRWL
jgi:hypothetical protein